MENIGIFLSSAVIAAVISGLAAWINKKNEHFSERVISERQKWREEIRKLSIKIYKIIKSQKNGSQLTKDNEKLDILRHELALRLNPVDEEDNKILKFIEERDARQFEIAMQSLLKHDWERSKIETKSHWKHTLFLILISLLPLIYMFNIFDIYPLSLSFVLFAIVYFMGWIMLFILSLKYILINISKVKRLCGVETIYKDLFLKPKRYSIKGIRLEKLKKKNGLIKNIKLCYRLKKKHLRRT
jgi:hypothetical protein